MESCGGVRGTIEIVLTILGRYGRNCITLGATVEEKGGKCIKCIWGWNDDGRWGRVASWGGWYHGWYWFAEGGEVSEQWRWYWRRWVNSWWVWLWSARVLTKKGVGWIGFGPKWTGLDWCLDWIKLKQRVRFGFSLGKITRTKCVN